MTQSVPFWILTFVGLNFYNWRVPRFHSKYSRNSFTNSKGSNRISITIFLVFAALLFLLKQTRTSNLQKSSDEKLVETSTQILNKNASQDLEKRWDDLNKSKGLKCTISPDQEKTLNDLEIIKNKIRTIKNIFRPNSKPRGAILKCFQKIKSEILTDLEIGVRKPTKCGEDLTWAKEELKRLTEKYEALTKNLSEYSICDTLSSALEEKIPTRPAEAKRGTFVPVDHD